MKEKNFAIQLKNTIKQIKSNGSVTISCDHLIAYLDEVINSQTSEITSVQFEKYKADLQLWVENNKANQASSLELFRSVITSGQNAIRSSFLLNGGAAVALLAFISNLTENHKNKVVVFADSLIPFVCGVLLIAITSGVTYLSQWFYCNNDCSWKNKTGFFLNILAIIFGLFSYVCFIYGMYRAYVGFQNFS